MNTGDIIAGKYRIIRTIGKGGMGCVYLAEDIASGGVYAVKEAIVSRAGRRAIRSEVNIQSKLDHPAIPKIIETAESDSSFVIVMEYVEGKGLDRLLKDMGDEITVRLSEERVRKWALQLSGILAYLHSLDPPIVYRDMKPSNIIIDPEDNVHLIDFGIAAEFTDESSYINDTLALTKGYAAPEQYDQRYLLDFRTDIYAFGATVHYLLTGKNPNRPPYQFDPVRSLNPRVSEGMEKIVMQCLRPNPDERTGEARQLEQELLETEKLTARLKKEKKKSRGKKLLIAGVVAAAMAFGFFTVKSGNAKKLEEYRTLVEQSETLISHRDFTTARGMLETAAAAQPELPDAYIQLANILYLSGEFDESLEYIRVNIIDRFPEAMQNKSFLRLMVNLYEAAGDEETSEYYFGLLNELTA